jgi:uncharacterized damage-inducible protein DinB
MTPEQGKTMAKFFLDTMKSETELTKKVIQAVPDDKKAYKPDPKSMSAHDLAWHIATSEVWFLNLVITGKPDMSESQAAPGTISEILKWYQENYTSKVSEIEKLSADKLVVTIPFFGIMELPAVSYLNIMNLHSSHHRGQLSTYLRPMGSKVPSIYGGSADEPFQG